MDVLEHQDVQLSGDLELEALRRSVMEVFDEYIKANPKVAPETLITVSDIDDTSRFADVIASNLTIKIE